MTVLRHRIRARREALGKSQTDLANSCGLSPAVISHYESGKREPSLEALRLLACALHCKAGDLIDDIEVPPMVVCPTCAGHGAIPAPVAESMRREREGGEIPRRYDEWTDCDELWSVLWWDVEHTDGVISEPPEYIGCPKDGPWPWKELDQTHLLWVPLPKLARDRP